MMADGTDSDTVLPLPTISGHVLLEIHLAGSMTYVVDVASQGGSNGALPLDARGPRTAGQ